MGRVVRYVSLAVVLVCLWGGCGSNAAVETPENPAPKPQGDPVPASGSMPAETP